MGLRRRIELVATAYADELSLRSLAEVSAITARHTRDADAAITTELAGSGIIHRRLLDHGYTATTGNSYTRPAPDLAVAGGPLPELAVDLLVPSLDGRLRPQEHGGRSFDAAPGLALALAAEPLVIDVSARLLNGAVLEFAVPVPTVELALVIKALLLETPLRAARRDAAMHLHALARHSRRRTDLDVPASRLAMLVAALVGRPG